MVIPGRDIADPQNRPSRRTATVTTSPGGGSGGIVEREVPIPDFGANDDRGSGLDFLARDIVAALRQANLTTQSTFGFQTDDPSNDREGSASPPADTTTTPTGGSGTATSGGVGAAPTGGGGGGASPPAPPPTTDSVDLNTQGATLVKVQEPSGLRYYLEYIVHGVRLRYEVGDQEAFDALGPQDYDAAVTITPGEFNQRVGLDVGLIDERFGLVESVAETIDRQLRIFGLEDIPEWQRQSPDVMTTLFTAADEGWSPGRTLQAIASTDAFGQRFPGLNAFRGFLGANVTLTDAVNAYTTQERQLRSLLNRVRGPNTDTSTGYLGELIGSGWTTEEVAEVLDFETRMHDGALENLNEILTFAGHDAVDANTLLDLTRGNASTEIVEALNDALRVSALENQGLNVDTALAAELGPGQRFGLESADALQSQAQAVALDVFANRVDLDLGRFGLNESDILRAAFNGDASAEVRNRLDQLARERSAAAQGFDVFSGFVNAEGRGQLVGLSGL